MNDWQDNAFCVPIYDQAESASGSQADDHSGNKQVGDEVVPVFCPGARTQKALAKSQEKAFSSGSLTSNPSNGHGDDKRPANGHNSADVRD